MSQHVNAYGQFLQEKKKVLKREVCKFNISRISKKRNEGVCRRECNFQFTLPLVDIFMSTVSSFLFFPLSLRRSPFPYKIHVLDVFRYTTTLHKEVVNFLTVFYTISNSLCLRKTY